MPNQPELSELPSATLHVEGADTCLHIANHGEPAHVLAVVRVARGLIGRNLDPAVATAQLVSVLLSGFIEPSQIQVTSLPGDPRRLGTYSICPSMWRVVRHVSPTGVELDDIDSSHFTDRQQADYELMFEQVRFLSRMVVRAQRLQRGGKSLGVSERVDEIRRVRDLARGSVEWLDPEELAAEEEACFAACEEDWWSTYRSDGTKGTQDTGPERCGRGDSQACGGGACRDACDVGVGMGDGDPGDGGSGTCGGRSGGDGGR